MLLRLEVILFLLSSLYIIYYIIDYLYLKLVSKFTLKKQIKKLDEKHNKSLTNQAEVVCNTSDSTNKKNTNKKKDKKNDVNVSKVPHIVEKLQVENSEQLREIVKRAQMNISRWYLETARNIVIEGLAMKKQDKELNILLAEIYEREKKYQNAAYIYKDLYDEYPEDTVIMQKLWNALYLLGDNMWAFEIYILVHKKNRSNTEVLDILSHLSIDIKDFKAWLKYANRYLKEKPRNAEKLWIKAYCLEKIWRIRESIEAYSKILDVQPYNNEVIERIKTLESRADSDKDS